MSRLPDSGVFLTPCIRATCLIVLLFSSPLLAPCQSVSSLMKQGDEYAAKFQNDKALGFYQEAHALDPNDCTALWKIAEAYVNLGEEADKKVWQQYFYVAEKWAQKAVDQCPEVANAHFFVAVTAGRLALIEGGKNKLERSRIVKEECERTLQLDPDHHGAYHLLGRWNAEIATLSWVLKTAAKIVYGGVPPGASLEAAVENLQRAIEISPNWINHHRQLGEVYMKMKEWELARNEFEKVLALPVVDHEDERHKRLCRKFLDEIKDK